MSTPQPAEPDNVHPLQRHPSEALAAHAWTADALMAAEFPDPTWAVPGVIAEGVNVLAGPPKVGKSWMSLGLALAVAGGGRAFDMIDVEPGPVLYLALEDTPRRLKTRMGKLLGNQPAPPDLTLATTCPTLPAGGDQAIAGWLDAHPGARMVVLDVFAKIRGTAPQGMSAYDADYAAVSRAKRIADDYGIAMVLVHHVRKMGSEDFLAEVSGTNGIAGAADAVLVLKRGRNQADGVLNVTGRDVDEAEYALAFHAGSGAWQLLDGPASDHTMHDTSAVILRHVRENPGQGPKAIAEATGLPHENVKKTCQRLAKEGHLHSAGGRYRLPATAEEPRDATGQDVSPLSPLSPDLA
ncbi:AAA family ATPase [Saccharopolyspora hirsuta]|uniref:AAA family ATPase n=1 Tax=Saccharopolyspora hirsuta TaxID=1837 RepID=A0A5M7BKV8_SACHI|nr:AAA family ATPase [Saccharopolyspora hirsuta]KAA5829550.1 AAA family ATPase [Saccharopolyspora hirsuta]